MRLLLAILTGFAFCAFVAHEAVFTVPAKWPAPVYRFEGNPLSAPKAALGRALFYEPLLSKNNTISCESCHSPYSAFAHIDHKLSHGINDSIGRRNAPALMNLAWQTTFMWDGAVHNLDMQALAPISHPAEMGSQMEEVVAKLNASAKYRTLFYRAFGDSSATGEHTLKALSQFMLTLVSANSKYDKVMRNQAIFTEPEAKGYRLFKSHCASCHAEPLFTNNSFQNNGLPVDARLKDYGRLSITGLASDSLRFKVPTLRNIQFTYPYMHDGRFASLRQVLNHYAGGVTQSTTVAPALARGLALTSDEKTELISFLLTLSDTAFVFNQNHQYPK